MAEVTKPKIKPEEMISVSLNFDNFKKYIDYMEEMSKSQLEKWSDINLKISKFDALQRIADDVVNKFDSYDKKMDDYNTTLNWHQSKFLEMEEKANILRDKVKLIEEFEKKMLENGEKIRDFEQKIENIIQSTDETNKKAESCHFILSKVKVDLLMNLEQKLNEFATIDSVKKVNENLKKHFSEEIERYYKNIISPLLEGDEDNISELKTKLTKVGAQVNCMIENYNYEEMDEETNKLTENKEFVNVSEQDGNNAINNNEEIIQEKVEESENFDQQGEIPENFKGENEMEKINDNESSDKITKKESNNLSNIENKTNIENLKLKENFPELKTNSNSNVNKNLINKNQGKEKNNINSNINANISNNNNNITQNNVIPSEVTKNTSTKSNHVNKEIESIKRDLVALKSTLDGRFDELRSEMKAIITNKINSIKLYNDFLLNDNSHNMSLNEHERKSIEENNHNSNQLHTIEHLDNLNDANIKIHHSNLGNFITQPDINNEGVLENSTNKKINLINLPANNNSNNGTSIQITQLILSVAHNVKLLEDRMKRLEETMNYKINREMQLPNTQVASNKLETTSLTNPNSEENKQTNDMTILHRDVDSSVSVNMMQELVRISESHTFEINKINRLIEELSGSVAENSELLHMAGSSIGGNNNKSSVNKRLNDLEKNVNKLRSLLDEGESKHSEEKAEIREENNNDNIQSVSNNSVANTTSLREMIKNTVISVKILTDRADKMQIKLDHITAEVMNRIKKDLAGESHKLLEDFRVDLKLSILKLDDQLKEKVDKINFDEYGKKMDNKLSTEVSKKIDKSELKKNNCQLNKKIENLETKISKTLVDALIDIQSEDAPLIVKKGINRDKCVSCNQIIMSPTITPLIKYNELAERYKLKNIQELSTKLGVGSYSRILSNCQPENILDQLSYNPSSSNISSSKVRKNNHSVSSFVSLPDISPGIKSSLPEKVPNLAFNKVFSHQDTFTPSVSVDKKINSVLEGELEKKIVKGGDLIKSVNRLYESLEKK